MKKVQILIMMVVACVGLMSCSQRLQEGTTGQAGRADKIVAALHDASTRYVVVVAHRGDWRNYPKIPSLPSSRSSAWALT